MMRNDRGREYRTVGVPAPVSSPVERRRIAVLGRVQHAAVAVPIDSVPAHAARRQQRQKLRRAYPRRSGSSARHRSLAASTAISPLLCNSSQRSASPLSHRRAVHGAVAFDVAALAVAVGGAHQKPTSRAIFQQHATCSARRSLLPTAFTSTGVNRSSVATTTSCRLCCAAKCCAVRFVSPSCCNGDTMPRTAGEWRLSASRRPASASSVSRRPNLKSLPLEIHLTVRSKHTKIDRFVSSPNICKQMNGSRQLS